MSFTKIATAGAGTIGSQVAWQMAFHGKHVIVYDAIPEGLQKGKSLHREYAEHFIDQRGAVQKQIDDTFARLTVRRTDLHGLLLQAFRGVASVETRFGCVVVSADRSGVVRDHLHRGERPGLPETLPLIRAAQAKSPACPPRERGPLPGRGEPERGPA
jgi:3-hydroxyacyl-CoA dehydrogenase, NAD binding domain